MGGFALISDKIHQVKEPEQPGLLSTSTDWDPYAEYVRRKKRYELGVLTFDQFKTLVGNVPFPDITPAQINDRSKGDGLSKLLAILQSSWFIAQCIARGVQGLALTELELVTLAMASLNAITFVFWWNKPLSVQEPVHVYVAVPVEEAEKNNRDKDPGEIDVVYYTAREVVAPFQEISEVSFDPRHQLQHIRDGEYSDVALHLVLFPVMLLSLAFLFFPLGILFLLWLIKSENVDRAGDDDMVAIRVELSLRRLRYKLTHPIRQYFGSRNGPLSRILDSDFGDDPASFAIAWFLFIPASFHLLVLLLITLSPLFAIFSIASFTFTAAFGIVTTNKVPRGATHVPPFYAPRTNSDRFSRMIVFAIFGVIFGSIHCIAWNFSFPTSTERSLWRYTSLVLTAIPLVVAPIDCALENLKDIFGKKSRLAFAILMTALLFLYVPARMSLIFQALALLRDQPASAYVAVDWTKYIPHLFSS